MEVLLFVDSLRVGLLSLVTPSKTSFLPSGKLTTTVTYTISLSRSDPSGTFVSLGSGKRPCAFAVRPAVLVFLAPDSN